MGREDDFLSEGGRGPGVCGIPAEMKKAYGESMAWWLRAIIVKCYPPVLEKRPWIPIYTSIYNPQGFSYAILAICDYWYLS